MSSGVSTSTHEESRKGAFSGLIDLSTNQVKKVRVPRSLIGQIQRIPGAAVYTFDRAVPGSDTLCAAPYVARVRVVDAPACGVHQVLEQIPHGQRTGHPKGPGGQVRWR